MSITAFVNKVAESARGAYRSAAGFWLAVCAFVIAFVPSLLHNLFFCESRIMLATDGKHFLTTVGLVVQFLQHADSGNQAQNLLAQSELPRHIIFDGPLMALIYSPLFLLQNKIPTPRDWTTLSGGQSFLHGCTSAILALLVLRLTGSRFFALMAAVIYGLYPPAVLQTGHFMSEVPVTMLLVLLLLLLTSIRHKLVSWSAAGIAASLIVLTKPALIPASFIAILIALFQQAYRPPAEHGNTSSEPVREPVLDPEDKQDSRPSPPICKCSALKGILAPAGGLILGIALVFVPWGIFSITSTGHFVPTPQRRPLYNVVTGWNNEADGWGYNPHPPFTAMFCGADEPLPTALGIWISRPQESARLTLSKISRLTSCPWNDFKGRALGLDENAQILLHRLIIACAAFGVGMFIFCARSYLQQNQRALLTISLAVIIAHLSYVMVESLPRYCFTAMPFAVLLAVYGIWQASRLSFQDKNRTRTVVCSAAFALVVSALLLHAENICRLFYERALDERAYTVNRFDKIEKEIDLTGLKIPEKRQAVLLLVDGDKDLEKSTIEVNGSHLQGRLISTMHFDPQHYAIFDQLREFGPAMRISVDDFRQWRALPVDAGLINFHGKNRIVITNNAKTATIYGDRRQKRFLPSFDYCNYGILAAAPLAAGAESRYTDPILVAAAQQISEIRRPGSKENSTSLPAENSEMSKETLKSSLRVRLLVMVPDSLMDAAEGHAGPTTPEKQSDASVHTINVPRETFDRLLWDTSSPDCLRINRVILYAAGSVGADIALPDRPASSHLKLRVTGELKALKNAGEVGMLCALKGANGTVQILGKTPRALAAAPVWQKFQIDDLVPTGALGGKAKSIILALYPCPWMEGQYGVSRRATDAIFRRISVEVCRAELPSISGRRIIY